MGKSKCKSKEMKSQVEQLEAMVQKLKGEMKKNSSTIYKFTEEQLVEFATELHNKFMDNMSNQLIDCDFDSDGIVSIEVDDLMITPIVDTDYLVDEITSNVICPEEDEMMDIVYEVLSDLGLEQTEEVEE
jgi:hypothetical protein